MTYELYRYIFIVGAILAGILLVISVLLFFFLRIPHVLGDLTGRNAKKAIENIRNQNERTGDKIYKTSHVNRERGKITDKISPSGRVVNNQSGQVAGAMMTEKISTQKLPLEETAVLDASNETTVLNTSQVGETEVLMSEDTSTAFQIEYEITYIHTDEVIA